MKGLNENKIVFYARRKLVIKFQILSKTEKSVSNENFEVMLKVNLLKNSGRLNS